MQDVSIYLLQHLHSIGTSESEIRFTFPTPKRCDMGMTSIQMDNSG